MKSSRKSSSNLNTRHPRKKEKSDAEGYRQTVLDRVIVSKRKFQIYYLVIKERMCGQQVSEKLGIAKQVAGRHIKLLETLGLIEPIEANANPKFYKATNIIPATSWDDGKIKKHVLVNKNAKQPERRLGKPLKAVRDHATGRFKGKRESPGEGVHRDYNSLISIDGKRIPILRVHNIAFTCSMMRDPMVNVPWEKVGGPNGMEQWVYRHKFPNKKTEIATLKQLEVTFVRQKTETYDELVIYLPEKYIFEYELRVTEKILKDFVWKARKWFQNKFKSDLGLCLSYRDMSIAREVDEPGLKRFVEEHGMVTVLTSRGYAMVDKSKKPLVEKEYSSIEEVEVDLHSSDRILQLETELQKVLELNRQLRETVEEMSRKQTEFFDSVRATMGVQSQKSISQEKENIERGMMQ